MYNPSLELRPSHVFQRMREDLVDFSDVMMTYLLPFLPQFVEMVADTSSLHHQINQAFLFFLT